MLLRCGSAWPPGLAVMSVFGSAPPDESLAFFEIDRADDRADRQELAGRAGVEVGRAVQSQLHGVVDRLRHVRGGCALAYTAPPLLVAMFVQLRLVAGLRLDGDDVDRHALWSRPDVDARERQRCTFDVIVAAIRRGRRRPCRR